MSEVKVNKISPRTACGTVTLGDSGDTFTIPSGATITNAGTASGFGATGETSWDTTVKTNGTFTATAGVGYFLNTTAGTITVNLAAGTAGDSVAMADYAATWQTNNVTVAANGTEKIGGVDADITLSTEGQSVTFVYIDGTQGWVNVLDSTSNVRGNAYLIATGGTISCCGNDKIHKFTGPGTFTVCTVAACAANNLVSYAVVAGGGGGGGHYGGGGGAGGYRETKSPSTPYTASPLDGYATPGNRITVTATGYPIAIGAAGTAGTHPASPFVGGSGGTSTFSTIDSAGGGGGATEGGAGVAGGSGGGGSYDGGAAGAGNTPPTTPDQGFNGGTGGPASPYYTDGGGGGATEVGQNGLPSGSGRGGAGATTSISASSLSYSGGGGAGAGDSPTTGGAASPCGTGGAGSNKPGTGSAGTINRGGAGGGGVNSGGGGLGGSGVVIIRYKYQ